MSVLVDTSAFFALLDADDDSHGAAARAWRNLLGSGESLITTNYIVVETDALIRKRLGIAALRAFHEAILPSVATAWVDEQTHAAGVSALLAGGRSGPSLVDCVSFGMMRRVGAREVFTFDRHFAREGFICEP